MIYVKLTEKQRKFADEYIKDLNGARAYKVAYPSVKKDTVAKAAASRLLTNVNLKTYIQEQLDEMHNKATADAQEVIEYLSAVMRGQQTETVATAKGIYDDVPVSAKDRIKAAELIGKRFAMWTDKQEINANIKPVEIIDNIPGKEDDADG